MSDQNNASSSPTPPAPPPARHAISAHGLTPAQNAALTVILAGGGMIAAANAAKVHRGTLYRWMQKDADFQRALEWEQDRAICTARRQLMTFVEDCASTVRNAVRCGIAEKDRKLRVGCFRRGGGGRSEAGILSGR